MLLFLCVFVNFHGNVCALTCLLSCMLNVCFLMCVAYHAYRVRVNAFGAYFMYTCDGCIVFSIIMYNHGRQSNSFVPF